MKLQKIKLQMIKEQQAIYYLDPITTPKDIVNFVNSQEHYDLATTEHIIVIGLDTKNKVNIYTEVATGATGYTNFKMAEVFKSLLLSNSSKFILAHNHPSGDATPSKEDMQVTAQVEEASKLMGLTFLDHIIITDNNYTSIMSEKAKEVK